MTTFVLDNVNDDYFEGTIILSDQTNIPFGRCAFDMGINIVLEDRNPDTNKWRELFWISIDPMKMVEGLSEDDAKAKKIAIRNEIRRLATETLAEQRVRIQEILIREGIDSLEFEIEFSPFIQVITATSALGVSTYSLLPGEALLAYPNRTGLTLAATQQPFVPNVVANIRLPFPTLPKDPPNPPRLFPPDAAKVAG